MSQFDLIYADADILVVNKAPDLLSVPGRGPDKQDCLIHRVQAVYPDALAVHRLDMATSGLLLMARGAAMHRQRIGIDGLHAVNQAILLVRAAAGYRE